MWKEANVGSLIRDTGVTGVIIDKLRIMCGKPGPVFRPSLKYVWNAQTTFRAGINIAIDCNERLQSF